MRYVENYEGPFAADGSRVELSQLLWELGWRDIVGGVNGVPTVQQFNEVCGRIDRKVLELYENKLDLDGDASELMVGKEKLLDYIKDVGSRQVFFEMAAVRENIKSGETMDVILGKIQKYFADLKPNCFVEADDPFVLMTETTYKPPEERTKGSLYALATRIRGLIVITFNRYITGTEEPKKDKTIYGIEKTERANLQKADNQYKGILYGVEYREDGDGLPRKNDVFYAIKRTTKGE